MTCWVVNRRGDDIHDLKAALSPYSQAIRIYLEMTAAVWAVVSQSDYHFHRLIIPALSRMFGAVRVHNGNQSSD